MRVLVVEDEARIAQFLKKGLSGRDTRSTRSGTRLGARRIVSAAPDLVILT
jgi:DNA-binding response OmpR family regulator